MLVVCTHAPRPEHQSINQSDYIQSAKWSGMSSPMLVVCTRAPRPEHQSINQIIFRSAKWSGVSSSMLVVCTRAPRPEHQSINQIILSQRSGAECHLPCRWCAPVHLVLSTNQSIRLYSVSLVERSVVSSVGGVHPCTSS
jgi:hypothetical protein